HDANCVGGRRHGKRKCHRPVRVIDADVAYNFVSARGVVSGRYHLPIARQTVSPLSNANCRGRTIPNERGILSGPTRICAGSDATILVNRDALIGSRSRDSTLKVNRVRTSYNPARRSDNIQSISALGETIPRRDLSQSGELNERERG